MGPNALIAYGLLHEWQGSYTLAFVLSLVVLTPALGVISLLRSRNAER